MGTAPLTNDPCGEDRMADQPYIPYLPLTSVPLKRQRKTHQQVQRALARGKVARQPCALCGSTFRVHAHHDDYDKPLEVRWLCPEHHSQVHGGFSYPERGRGQREVSTKQKRPPKSSAAFDWLVVRL